MASVRRVHTHRFTGFGGGGQARAAAAGPNTGVAQVVWICDLSI